MPARLALAKAHVAEGAPARSLVFLAVTAEEAGLIGSDYYATHPVYRLGKTVGGINIDVLNVAGRARDMVVVGRGKSELEAILERWSARQDRGVLRSEERRGGQECVRTVRSRRAAYH